MHILGQRELVFLARKHSAEGLASTTVSGKIQKKELSVLPAARSRFYAQMGNVKRKLYK